MKLQHKGTYILKGIDRPITLRENNNGQFWYVDSKDCNKTVYVTEEDVIKPVFISRNDLEIQENDIVLYIKDLWNGGTTVDLGQVTGFKNVKVQVKFEDRNSTIFPDNLYVITENRVRNANTWLK